MTSGPEGLPGPNMLSKIVYGPSEPNKGISQEQLFTDGMARLDLAIQTGDQEQIEAAEQWLGGLMQAYPGLREHFASED